MDKNHPGPERRTEGRWVAGKDPNPQPRYCFLAISGRTTANSIFPWLLLPTRSCRREFWRTLRNGDHSDRAYVRFVRPNIQTHYAHMVELHQWVFAWHLAGQRLKLHQWIFARYLVGQAVTWRRECPTNYCLSTFATARHRLGIAHKIKTYFSLLFATVYFRSPKAVLFLGTELGTGWGRKWPANSPRAKSKPPSRANTATAATSI